MNEYSELQITTNFSFLRGATHPHEYAWRAAELGYRAIGITDYNTLAGVVRAHRAARDAGIQVLIGARIEVDFQGSLCHDLENRSPAYERSSILLYPTSRAGYSTLCRLITLGKQRLSKDESFLTLADIVALQNDLAMILVPPFFHTRIHRSGDPNSLTYNARQVVFFELCKLLCDQVKDKQLLSIALTHNYGPLNHQAITSTLQIARALTLPVVATNDVYYHTPERKPLQDLLTCIRHRCTVQQAGFRLFQNGERFLKPAQEMHRLFRAIPHALRRTIEITEMAAGFSLTSLTYTYPDEICPNGTTPQEYLAQCVQKGARERYPPHRYPDGIPAHVEKTLREELELIHELEYEKYFLTCHDIVTFARSRGILCQGRGAAANSAVCFCLGITSVDPTTIDLLFARFVSKERREPPDIDIDFEHERREEVIQYIYTKYGHTRAALTAEVVTYRARSAVRDVGKALGLSLEVVTKLAKAYHRWTGSAITPDDIRELGLDPFDTTIQNTLALTQELIGFPRHLSQHVGGFVICNEPLCEIVPIIPATMEARSIIEWDKDDIEELGMLKIDILALGMLTCIRKALELVNRRRAEKIALHSIPAEDPNVYQMLCASDTIGVFQVESRAQMSMLPRLRPRCFYDLVVEVAIVRPGPIQGNMVHPYLRRRSGLEKPHYPDERVRGILGKTLGVPIFQEQAMRLAIVLANFSPGEAEQLRRAMSAWKSHPGVIATFKEKIVRGMCANGYSVEFAETCLNQIKGFSEYGFPESHAASFALLVYASAWLKRYYPAEFACALLNSQPMGFYAPAQILRDAQNHGVQVVPIDANHSSWDCTVHLPDRTHTVTATPPQLRLGLRLIRGLRRDQAERIARDLTEHGEFQSISELWNRSSDTAPRSTDDKLHKTTLTTLARADAFASLSTSRQGAHWEVQELPKHPAPLDALFTARHHAAPTAPDNQQPHHRSQRTTLPLPASTVQGEMFQDYATTGISLRAHPLQFFRPYLNQRGVHTASSLLPENGLKSGTIVSAAGIPIVRQRPGTAKGVVFLTLEDETGLFNVILRPHIFEQHQKIVMYAPYLLATGKLERIGAVVYVDAAQVQELQGRATRADAR